MKKIYLTLIMVMSMGFASIAQVGSVAADFTVTDINGNSFNLYKILDQGKVVILDCSATWCPPCWGFHKAKYLEEIHNTYGPEGTDQVQVIFYEADGNTNMNDLEGKTSASQGNWLEGTSYPVINESPLQLPGNQYWPQGFPTVNVISPEDKKIKSDLWSIHASGGTLADMVDSFDEYFKGTASLNNQEIVQLNTFPNPANDQVNLSFQSNISGSVEIEILNLLGEVVLTSSFVVESGANNKSIDVTALESGQYFAKINSQSTTKSAKFNVVK